MTIETEPFGPGPGAQEELESAEPTETIDEIGERPAAPEAQPAPAVPMPGGRAAGVAPMRMPAPPIVSPGGAPHHGMPNPMRPAPEGEDGQLERTATAPQLRRFIKSRVYVPMHELRRRFGINGGDDEVTPVDLERARVFVGLPEREGRLLAELLRGGDIGYELSMDPVSPIVVGVYPMRPVTRG